MTMPTLDRGVLAEENQDKREELIRMLKKAYWMETETVMSYIANSVNPDGVKAQEVVENLEEDIAEELDHAQVKGVIEAEKGAIEHYARIVEFCDDFDLVTQDMVIAIQRDEEGHLRLFEGFLREFEAEGLA